MQLFVYLISAFLLIVGTFVIFRIFVRRDYRRQGRLTPFSSFLELLIWFLYMCFPYIYHPSDWPWAHDPYVSSVLLKGIGWIAVTVGPLAFITMFWFGLRRAFGLEVNKLIQTGPYRITRNPQIVGFALLIVGFAVLWPSWYALGWVILYPIIAHTMILTEEEHLRNVYGEEYERYCQRVPRYLGFL